MSRFKRDWAIFMVISVYIAVMAITICFTADWTAIQTVGIILTGLVVIWYTWETKLLRHATYAQRELLLRPFVVVELKNDGFWARNIGHGSALNIMIEDVVISKDAEIVVKFKTPIFVLEPGHSARVAAESFHMGRTAGEFFLAHLDSQYTNKDLELQIKFQNIEMQPYSCIEAVRPNNPLSVIKVSSYGVF